MSKERSQESESSFQAVLPQVREVAAALGGGHSGKAEQCCTWTQLHWDLARSQGLAPWFYTQLSDCMRTGIPPQVKESLRRDYLLSTRATIFRDMALRQVLEAFGTLGLAVVPLKGVYLSSVVYDDPASRTMCDIDLLVEEGDFQPAQDALISMGFSYVVDPVNVGNRVSCPAISYVRAGSPYDAIDLHQHVCCMDHYSFPSSAVWAESTVSTLHGCEIRLLSPELNFIHIGAHSLGHGPLLRDWLDLVLIVKRTPFQWGKFARLAALMGVLRPMYWVVQELTRHWDLRPPEEVGEALGQYRPRPLEDWVIRSRWRYIWRIYSKVSAREGWREKIRYLRHQVFPPVDYREAVVGSTSRIRYVKSKMDFFVYFWRQS